MSRYLSLIYYIMCMLVRLCESPRQDVKPLASQEGFRIYHRGYILYVQQWKTILSSPAGARVGVRKARAVPPLCITIVQDYRCPFSTAFRLPDRLTWYGSTHQIPCTSYICTSRAMIVPTPITTLYSDACNCCCCCMGAYRHDVEEWRVWDLNTWNFDKVKKNLWCSVFCITQDMYNRMYYFINKISCARASTQQ